MVKFSTKSNGSRTIVNRAGGKAYVMTPIETLVQITTTTLFAEPKYYGDVQKQMDDAIDSVAKTDPEFILKLANYCRNELYLRTVSIYLLVKAANIPECKPFVKAYTPKIVQRADEIYEALSAHINLFSPEAKDGKHKDKKIPNSLKKGLRLCFPKFDEYAYGKYSRKTNVKFKDAIMLVHPKEPAEIIKKILDDKLEIPKTWETVMSSWRNNFKSEKEAWEHIIDTIFVPEAK